MPEPIVPTELLQPQRLTIGETPVYLTTPLEVDGKQVTQLTIKGASKRTDNGVDSAVIIMEEKSRKRGEEGKPFTKILDNINEMEEVDWAKVAAITFTDEGGTKRHLITKDQLSLTKPEESTQASARTLLAASQGESLQEPKLARSILEKYSGEPTTLTIVGLKAYETRAHDLAAKSMQVKPEAPKDILRALDNIGENIWKHGIGPVYFQEKARQYYMDMLKASHSPFADRSIKIAEAAGKNRYQELLDNKNFLTRGSRRFIEWVKSSLGARTLAQQFALEEIAHMRETGEIKEMEAFEREGASIRKRFEIDFDAQDDVIRKTLGEKLDILDPTKAEHKPLVDDIRGLVRRYATGEIATKADFDKASDELFQTHLKGSRPDIFHEAELYSSSLYEVAESMRIKKDHVGGMEAINAQLEAMQVRLGMGVMGEATALEPTDVQKGTEMVQSTITWLEKKGIVGPFLLNEATVSSGVAVALSLAILPKTAISSLSRIPGGFIGFVGGAAVGAVFGGLREYRMLEREYLTHLREREAGLTFSPDAKRRAWMERFFVGQRSADDLITAMNSDDVQTKLANLADAKARKALSAQEHQRNAQRVGLIQFSGRENIETQRTALDLTIAQAEKDLLASGKTNEQFLADLTAAQTRILSEGVSRVEGLDDPLKVTLNLLDKYNPEVEVMRRRFPLLGPEAKTGAKAQGLEEILKEFRRAARGEAVRKGLVVGASGALIGLGIREGLQLGSEVLSNITQHTPDLSAAVEVNPDQNFQFSNNLHMDGTDLLDKDGHIVVAGLKDYAASHLDKGELTPEAKQWIMDQARQNGFTIDTPEAIKTSYAFTGSQPLEDILPGRSVSAPDQLHWEITDHGRELRLDFMDSDGNPAHQILYADAGRPPGANPDAVLDKIKEHDFLAFTPEDIKEHVAGSQSLRVDGIAPVIDAEDDPHFISALIPKGMTLNQTGDHTYALIDSATGKQIIEEITIDDTGKILNEDALNGNDLGITFRSPTGELLRTSEADAIGDYFNKPVSEMGAERGASVPWGWLEDPINADSSIDHALPGTNLAKNLFRGFEENYLSTSNLHDAAGNALTNQAHYTALHAGEVYHDLPKSLFEDSQLVKLGHLMDQAIKMKEVDGTDLADMDELHRAAYEIGRVGRVATDKEVQMFIDAMGGGTKEAMVQLYQPIIEQVTTETIPASIEGINGSVVTNIITLAERAPGNEFNWVPPIPIVSRRPLEQMVSPSILAQYPENPTTYGEYPMTEGYGLQSEYPVIYPPHAAYIPFYEQAFDRLNIPQQEREMLRKLSPQERIRKLYQRTDQLFDESLPYEDQIILLSQTLEVPLEHTRPLTQRELIATRIADQEHYLDSLGNRWATTSTNPRVLQTLYRINGASKDYMTELKELNASLPPMHPDCRMSVVIPVFNEGKKIEQTLRGWLDQYRQNTDSKVDANSFEIILFINRPNPSVAYDASRDVAEKLKTNPEYAPYHIHVVEKTFNITEEDRTVTINNQSVQIPKGRRMGLIYAIPTDLAAMRNMARTAPDDIKANHLIKAGGADVYARSPHYIDDVVHSFDNTPDMEQLNSRADYPARIYEHIPLFHVTERFREAMNDRYAHGNTNLGLGVMRSSLYAKSGGFNPSDDIAEEVRLNERMRKALLKRARREGKAKDDLLKRDSELRAIDNPRRALSAVWQGIPMLYDYTNFWHNDLVKTLEVNDILRQPVPKEAVLTPETLKLQLEPYIQYYARLMYQHHSEPSIRGNMARAVSLAKQYTEESLNSLGFRPGDYEWKVEHDMEHQSKVADPKSAVRSIQINFTNLNGVNSFLDAYKSAEKPEWTK